LVAPTEKISKPFQKMKKTILLVLAIAAITFVSVGCSASARINVPNGSIVKPSKDVQMAYVTKPVADER
jgi:hypothetical protein